MFLSWNVSGISPNSGINRNKIFHPHTQIENVYACDAGREQRNIFLIVSEPNNWECMTRINKSCSSPAVGSFCNTHVYVCFLLHAHNTAFQSALIHYYYFFFLGMNKLATLQITHLIPFSRNHPAFIYPSIIHPCAQNLAHHHFQYRTKDVREGIRWESCVAGFSPLPRCVHSAWCCHCAWCGCHSNHSPPACLQPQTACARMWSPHLCSQGRTLPSLQITSHLLSGSYSSVCANNVTCCHDSTLLSRQLMSHISHIWFYSPVTAVSVKFVRTVLSCPYKQYHLLGIYFPFPVNNSTSVVSTLLSCHCK